MKVIIIGSGIAGLASAIALRRVGIDVAVYERAPQLTEVGAGISLWANALRALDAIGAGDAVRGVAQAQEISEFRAANGFRRFASFTSEQLQKATGIRPVVVMTHRADLVAALAAMLPVGVARYGYECVGVDNAPEQPIARFANGHEDRADLLIGADGIRSAVRAALFGAEAPRYAGYTCWRGVGPRPALLPAGYVGEWWGRGRRFGICTLPGDRVYWFSTLNHAAGGAVAEEKALVVQTFDGWADPVPEIIASTRAEAIIRSDIVDRPPRKPWLIGRTGLIGDAAHPTTPNLGQGGCMALEDAVVLARCLKGAADPVKGLADFAEERYRRTTFITRRSWSFGRIGQMDGRVSCFIRNNLFALATRIGGPGGFLKPAMFDVGELPVK
jgi:2-polyprenyl-6-methoxyphenol hydroxylase-like FAD-dependent oxidoreductase